MDDTLWKELATDFDVVLDKLPAALAAEGFGVITQINVQQTFREKLGRETPRYRILGACNPALAFEAIKIDPRVGVRLPCNVVIYEREGGGTMLGVIDPIASLGDHDPALKNLAAEVRAKLARVVAAVD